jgi:hypothetical protein
MNINYIVKCLLIAGIIITLCWLYRRKKIILEDHEILEFVSYTRWKSGRRICKEIKARYRCRISYGEFYCRMRHLVEEGYVEKRDIVEIFEGEKITVREFKKLHGGGPPKRRIKIRFFERKPVAFAPQPA